MRLAAGGQAVQRHPVPVSAPATRRARLARQAWVLVPAQVVPLAEGTPTGPHPVRVTPVARDQGLRPATRPARGRFPVPLMLPEPDTVIRRAPPRGLLTEFRHLLASRRGPGRRPGGSQVCRPAATCRTASPCLRGQAVPGPRRLATTPIPARPDPAPDIRRQGIRRQDIRQQGIRQLALGLRRPGLGLRRPVTAAAGPVPPVTPRRSRAAMRL
jgi:hypothetical protein